MSGYGEKKQSTFTVQDTNVRIYGYNSAEVVVSFQGGLEISILRALVDMLANGPQRVKFNDCKNESLPGIRDEVALHIKSHTPKALCHHVADTLDHMTSLSEEQIKAHVNGWHNMNRLSCMVADENEEAEKTERAKKRATHLVKKVVGPWSEKLGLFNGMDEEARKSALRTLRDDLAEKMKPRKRER